MRGLARIAAMTSLSWHPHLGTLATGLILLGLVAWLWHLYRRYRSVHPPQTTWLLLTPKILVALLLVLALLDPVWRAPRPPNKNDRVLTLVDASSSMDVKDSAESRARRAAVVVDRLKQRLGGLVELDVRNFDTEVHETGRGDGAEKGIRGTDLGKVLAGLSTAEAAAYQAFILLTDGGDEPVRAARLPGKGLFITGFGTDPSTWNDLALVDVEAPTAIEEKTPFEVTADVIARSADGQFMSNLGAVAVQLEENKDDVWHSLGKQTLNLSPGRARVAFTAPPVDDVAIRKFRLRVAAAPGEMSLLNNERLFTVDVRRKSFYVLLYARQLDWDFSLLHRELKLDPAIKITALYRASAEQTRIEGDRQEGDTVLDKGFPVDARALDLYKCVILGSFPAADLTAEQQEALRKYVDGGGSVIFLGGPDSFGRGGYDQTPLAPLIPWHISRAEAEIMAGRFPVSVPPHASEHAAMLAAAKTLSQAKSPVIFSVNPVGKPRTGAVSLLDAAVGDSVVPVIALQRYGQGQSMGIASNTLWRWGRMPGEIKQAYQQFWQNSVRYLSGLYEGNRFLMVKWDRESYRPSEVAEGTLQVVGRSAFGQLRFTASVTHGKDKQNVPIEALPGADNKQRARVFFPDRGEYVFRVEALAGFDRVDAYERTFRVGPTRNEGARLEVDHAFLDDLAGRSGGAYAPEAEVERLIDTLRNRLLTGSVETDIRLVQEYGGYISLLLIILLAEWFVRRRMNLF